MVVSYPLFALAMAPLAGTLLHRLPYTVSIIGFSLLYVTGGIVYASVESVWMACIGYGLIGAGASLCSITVHTYLGEMGDVMDEIRKKQGKKPRKFLLYIAYSFVLTGGFILPFSLNSIMAQFEIPPYHWPGWMHAALAATVSTLALVFFTETRSLTKLSGKMCLCLAGLKLEAGLWSKQCKLSSYILLIGCTFLMHMFYVIFNTLITPVLSDQFGFSVKYISYFFLLVSAANINGSVIQI